MRVRNLRLAGVADAGAAVHISGVKQVDRYVHTRDNPGCLHSRDQ